MRAAEGLGGEPSLGLQRDRDLRKIELLPISSPFEHCVFRERMRNRIRATYSGFQLRSKIAYCVDFHASNEITVSAHGNYSCTFVF